MDTDLLRLMCFASSPKYVAIEIEKDLLFTLWKKENEPTKEELKRIQTEKDVLFDKRENKMNWTEIELYNGQSDVLIFLNFGKISLENLNRSIKWDERRFCG